MPLKKAMTLCNSTVKGRTENPKPIYPRKKKKEKGKRKKAMNSYHSEYANAIHKNFFF